MNWNAALIQKLEERAASYDRSGPSAKHTADLLREAAIALYRTGSPDMLEALKKCTDKLERAMVLVGSDSEYAAIGVSEFRSVIAKAEAKP